VRIRPATLVGAFGLFAAVLLAPSHARAQASEADPVMAFEALSNEALAAQQRGDPAEARRLLDQALAAMERAGDRVPLATQMWQLRWMRALYPGGDPTATPEVREKAVSIDKALLARLRLRDGASSEDIETVCFGLSWMTSVLRRRNEALDYSRCYFESLSKRLGANSEKTYAAQAVVGGDLVQLGRYDEAERTLSAAVAGLRTLGPASGDALLSALSEYQSLLNMMGRADELEASMRESLALLRDSGAAGAKRYLWMLGALANFYQEWGRFDEADDLIWQAYTTLDKMDPDGFEMAVATWRAGSAALRAGQPDEALELFERSRALHERHVGPQYLHLGTLLLSMSDAMAAKNDLPGAVAYARQALAFYEKNGSRDDFYAATARTRLAQLMSRSGEIREALDQYVQAQAILEKAEPSTQVTSQLILALGGKARMSMKLGDRGTARQAMESALGLIRRQIGSAQALRIDTARAQASYKEFVSLYLELASGDDAGKSFEASQLGHLNDTALSIVRMMDLSRAADSGLARTVRDREDAVRQLRLLQRQDVQGVDSGQAALAIQAAEARLSGDEQKLAVDYPAYKTITDSRPVTIKEIESLLRPAEALVSFYFDGDHGYVWAVTLGQSSFSRLRINGSELARQVADLRKGLVLRDGVPAEFDLGAAHALYESLLGPLETQLRDAQHVFVVPDGPLLRLPLSVLLTAQPSAGTLKDQPWVARKFALSVLPSVSSLPAFRRARSAGPAWKRPFSGVGDPDLGSREPGISPSGIRLGPLPETRRELLSMAGTLHASAKDLLLGADATVANVSASDYERVRVLAFATHAVTATDVPRLGESALVLTPTRTDDGLLRASHIARMRLASDWVILSACNTAGAFESPDDDGFAGLARAFFYAGAESVLASHWYVSSKATTELTTRMLSLYAAAPALGKASALQRAILQLQEGAGGASYAHPVYWGPFSLLGDGGARPPGPP
jgi:CHAT domain-containing protein/tetratricopeptide (TPR) repeat protein